MTEPVLFTRSGHLGRITLNAPDTLNALTLDMLRLIRAALQACLHDPAIRHVVIDANGTRAFCAGGDVAALYHAATEGNAAFARDFWTEEYRFNDWISRFPKPLIALIHGHCLGGGVGLAGHLPHRIVGESARIAMPECAIGLIPDVGGTALLTRAPRHVGPWLALTGARLAPRAAIAAGFADDFVPEAEWDALRAVLAKEDVAEVIPRFRTAPTGEALPDPAFLGAFAGASVPAIIKALHDLDTAEAAHALQAIERSSPLALHGALALQNALLQKGDLRQALRLEYRAALHMFTHGDFAEGVRARLIDRDNAPRWRHANIADVQAAEVAGLIAPITAELQFPQEL